MRAVTKFLRARTSEHSSNFCEQFEQWPNFASTFKLNGTIRYPSCECHSYNAEDVSGGGGDVAVEDYKLSTGA